MHFYDGVLSVVHLTTVVLNLSSELHPHSVSWYEMNVFISVCHFGYK